MTGFADWEDIRAELSDDETALAEERARTEARIKDYQREDEGPPVGDPSSLSGG